MEELKKVSKVLSSVVVILPNDVFLDDQPADLIVVTPLRQSHTEIVDASEGPPLHNNQTILLRINRKSQLAEEG